MTSPAPAISPQTRRELENDFSVMDEIMQSADAFASGLCDGTGKEPHYGCLVRTYVMGFVTLHAAEKRAASVRDLCSCIDMHGDGIDAELGHLANAIDSGLDALAASVDTADGKPDVAAKVLNGFIAGLGGRLESPAS